MKIKCNQCEDEFRYNKQLQKHIESVDTLKEIQCEKCDFKTNNEEGFKMHNQIVHECEKCPYISDDERDLQMHVQTTHKNLKVDLLKVNETWHYPLKKIP